MAVTIYDVGREAGVSISTVSRSLNDSFTIPEKTKQKVLEAAERLEYRPNARAKNFARQSTGTVLFATDLYKNIAYENPHLLEIICGVTTELDKKGYAILLKSVTRQLAPEYLKQVIMERVVDGLIVHANILSEEFTCFLSKCDFPYLVIGKPDSRTGICWMDVNHEQAGELAANYLLDRGYRKIAFLVGSEDQLSRSRQTGINHAMGEEELEVELVICNSNFNVEDDLLESLLTRSEPPEVLLCSNNHLALHCIQFINRTGRKTPDDIAVLTFDNYPFSTITEPKISAIDVDMNDLGVNAAQFILQRMKKPNLRTQSFCTLPSVMEREST